MNLRKKRGLSPVVATVLLILLVIALALLVFLWARGFLYEQIEKFGNPIESYCDQIYFEMQANQQQGEAAKYDLIALNRGDVGIRGFEIKTLYGGDSRSADYSFGLPAGESATIEIDLGLNGIAPDTVFVYPILAGNVKGKEVSGTFTCYDKQYRLGI